MGKVKTDQIKGLGKDLMAKFPDKFNTNFDDNKIMVSKLTQGATTRVRNQTAGYITRTYALAEAQNPTNDDEDTTEETEEEA
jgi:small subunit ribosomal protein S17e